MSKRPLALLLLLALAGCNRHGVADVTLDAAAAQRNATAAKTRADLQAAEAAARAPAPAVHDATPARARAAPSVAPPPAETAPEIPADDAAELNTNG